MWATCPLWPFLLFYRPNNSCRSVHITWDFTVLFSLASSYLTPILPYTNIIFFFGNLFFHKCWQSMPFPYNKILSFTLIQGNIKRYTLLAYDNEFKTLYIYIYIYTHTQINDSALYTGCNRRNGPDFGRVFLMLNYTEKPQNTYIQSWTVSEIMASEVWNFDSCYTLTDYQIHIETGRNMWFL